MTDELKKRLEYKFEKGLYDKIFDDDLVRQELDELSIKNYDLFCRKIINILNSVRIDRDILIEEKFYPYEELFANDFFRYIREALIRNENLDELPDEVFEKLKTYYCIIKNIGSASTVLYGEDANEKVK